MTTTTATVILPQSSEVYRGRVAWSAVFVGLFLALATYLFLGVLGTAVGTSSIDALRERNPLAGFGMGTGLWVGASTLVALGVGAFFAGRSAPGRGILHGILCWAVTTLVTVYAISSLAGGVIGAASSVAGTGLSIAGQGVAAAAPTLASGVKDQLQKNGINFDLSDARAQLETLLRQTGKPALDPDKLKADVRAAASDGKATAADTAATPQTSADDLAAFFERLRQKAQPGLDAADKDALVNIIAARTGKSRAEAEQVANSYEQSFNQMVAKYNAFKQQAEQKAREAGDAAAKGVSRAAWAGVIVLLLGALLSGGAGFLGRRSVRD